MHGARNRFRSVRAEVVERRHVERSRIAMERWAAGRPGTVLASSAAGPAVEPAEWWEAVTRVSWAKPDRLRLERDDAVQLVVGDRWWAVSDAFGAAAGDPSSEVQLGIEIPPFPAARPRRAAAGPRSRGDGEGSLLGRPVRCVRGVPRGERVEWAEPHVPGGADEHLLAIDVERGVVLRLASLVDGDPFVLTEVRGIAFDEALPEETWILRPPPGTEFGPLAMAGARRRWRDRLRSRRSASSSS